MAFPVQGSEIFTDCMAENKNTKNSFNSLIWNHIAYFWDITDRGQHDSILYRTGDSNQPGNHQSV